MLKGKQLQQSISFYLDNYCVDMSPETIRSKRDYLRWLVEFLDGKPYTLETVLAFRNHMYTRWKTPHGRADITRFLRAFTQWLAKNEYIPSNFAEKINKPPKAKRVSFDYVDPIIVDQIIDAATEAMPFKFGKSGDNSRNAYIKNEMRWALRFLLRTGLRISELINLSGHDLVLNDQTPSFWVLSKGSKYGEKDYLALPKDMLEELSQRANKERLFEITESSCNKVLRRGCEMLEIRAKITCHTLRHIFATNLTKQGVPIQTISRLLRHSDIRITQDYYQHLDVNDLSVVINNQSIVRNGLELHERIGLLERAIKATGVENDDRLLISWERRSSGGR